MYRMYYCYFMGVFFFIDLLPLSQTVALPSSQQAVFFIEFADATTKYTLPPDCHNSVNSY